MERHKSLIVRRCLSHIERVVFVRAGRHDKFGLHSRLRHIDCRNFLGMRFPEI